MATQLTSLGHHMNMSNMQIQQPLQVMQGGQYQFQQLAYPKQQPIQMLNGNMIIQGIQGYNPLYSNGGLTLPANTSISMAPANEMPIVSKSPAVSQIGHQTNITAIKPAQSTQQIIKPQTIPQNFNHQSSAPQTLVIGNFAPVQQQQQQQPRHTPILPANKGTTDNRKPVSFNVLLFGPFFRFMFLEGNKTSGGGK